MSMGTGSSNNALVSTTTPSNTIPSIAIDTTTTLANLPPNTWAYTLETGESAVYRSLPDPLATQQDQKQHTIKADGAMGTETTNVSFATKIAISQPSGQYQNSVLFTATTNEPPVLQPKAILGDNGNLNFVYDTNTYNVDDYYDDNLGHTQIKAVYNVPYTTDWQHPPAWYNNDNITTANFDSSFYNYQPTTTHSWFRNLHYLTAVSNMNNLNISQVTNLGNTFREAGRDAESFTLDLSSWDTKNVQTTDEMFKDCGKNAHSWTVTGLEKWDTSSLISVGTEGMFLNAGYKAESFHLNLSGWDVSRVSNMANMFNSAGYSAMDWSMTGLNTWDTGNVTTMQSMFQSTGRSANAFNLDLSGWDTGKVTNMANMFSMAGWSSTNFSLGNLGNWDTSNVTTMQSMFGCGYWADPDPKATHWFIGDLNHWDVSRVTNMAMMFWKAGAKAPNWSIGDLSQWDTSSVTTMEHMFRNAGYSATNWSIGDVSHWNTGNVNNMNFTFGLAGYSAQKFHLDLSNWDTKNVTNMADMFNGTGYSATTWSIGDLSRWNTSKATRMNSMFNSAGHSAPTWSIGDLSQWDTSSVTTMESMFREPGCQATYWSIGDISKWDTSNVTDMSNMFYQTAQQQTDFYLDLSGWDTGKVTNMSGMFSAIAQNAQTFELNLSGWDTSNVTNMYRMFGHWYGGSGQNATTYKIDGIENWNTSSLTNMQEMFGKIGAVSLDLSGWDTSNVTNMQSIFVDNIKLQTVYVGDGWNTDKVPDGVEVFHRAAPTGSQGTTFQAMCSQDPNHCSDKTYARIDNPPDYPGYFTYKGDNPDNPGGGSNIVNNITNAFNNIFNNNNTNNNTDNTEDPSSGYVEPMGVVNTNNSSINWLLIICLCILSLGLIALIIFLIWKLKKQRKVPGHSTS